MKELFAIIRRRFCCMCAKLNRFKQEGRESTESAMLYDYLDFLTGLSWKKEEIKQIDLEEAMYCLSAPPTQQIPSPLLS